MSNDHENLCTWAADKALVDHRLTSVERESCSTRKRVEKVEVQEAVQKAQQRIIAAIIGGLSGLIPVAIAIIADKL